MLSTSQEPTPIPQELSVPTITKKPSRWKLRRRTGSITSLSRGTRNNSSSVSLFAYGIRSQRNSTDDLHSVNSTQSTISNHNGYLTTSSPASIRALPNSSSLRSLVDFRRQHKEERIDNDQEFDKTHNAKKSSDSAAAKSSSSASLVHEVVALRSSIEEESASSSPQKVTFDIPGFMVTQPEEPEEAVDETPKIKEVIAGPDKKAHSFFGSFVNLLDSHHESPPVIPRSASAQSLQNVLSTQKSLDSKPTTTKIQAPTSAFKSPLLKIKKMLGSDSPEVETAGLGPPISLDQPDISETQPALAIDPSTPRSLAPSGASSPVSPRSLTPMPSNNELSFPELRPSRSNQDPSDFLDADGQLTPKPRPRSHTLSSLDQKRTSYAFPRPSIGNIFASKRSESEFSATNMSPPAGLQTPSPRPSTTVQRSSLTLPARLEFEPPEEFLDRVRQVGLGSYTAAALSKHDDVFHRTVLKLYLQLFSFVDDPLDMALRKFLISVRLPQETQHIDRVLESFAYRYHECNPDIYASKDKAYFIVFSLMILHTDFYNKNNKHKMLKSQYFQITKESLVSTDVLSVSFTMFPFFF